MWCYLEISVLFCDYSSYRNVLKDICYVIICQSSTASNCERALSEPAHYSLQQREKANKIRSVRSQLVFLIIWGIHFCAMVSRKTYVDFE